jgi:hypothetical protein
LWKYKEALPVLKRDKKSGEMRVGCCRGHYFFCCNCLQLAAIHSKSRQQKSGQDSDQKGPHFIFWFN